MGGATAAGAALFEAAAEGVGVFDAGAEVFGLDVTEAFDDEALEVFAGDAATFDAGGALTPFGLAAEGAGAFVVVFASDAFTSGAFISDGLALAGLASDVLAGVAVGFEVLTLGLSGEGLTLAGVPFGEGAAGFVAMFVLTGTGEVLAGASVAGCAELFMPGVLAVSAAELFSGLFSGLASAFEGSGFLASAGFSSARAWALRGAVLLPPSGLAAELFSTLTCRDASCGVGVFLGSTFEGAAGWSSLPGPTRTLPD